MRKRSAGSFVRTHAFDFAGREHRRVVDGQIALRDVIHQQLPVLLGEFAEHGGANRARRMATQRRMHQRGSRVHFCNRRYLAKR